MTWRRNGATAETVGGSIWRGKGLEKGPWVQASPGKHLETELADLGLVAEGPPLAILGGLSKCEYTTRPIRSFRLCRNTRTHDVPFGPSFHRPLALPWEGPSSAQILSCSSPAFTLWLLSKRRPQEASVGRRELGQKPQADAPAKEQSPGHLSPLQTNTHSSRPGRRLRDPAWEPC